MSLFDPRTPCLEPEAYYALCLTRFSMPLQHVHARCEIMYVV